MPRSKVPPRPTFHIDGTSAESRGIGYPDADPLHAYANNMRLEHIMTLLEVLIQSVEDFRKDIDDIDRGRNG